MKVKQLMAQLERLDPELEVYLQEDPEGNGYRTARGSEEGVYEPDGFFGPSVLSLCNTAEDNDMTEEEWQALKDGPHCVVIYP